MDTGLGSKAYSIIEQGKIGLILSSKPADRRALIEEAAGITKYKARRRQTQLKLEAAQQNLLRVNDIVHEVEKQLESLKRQASKARRYRAVREEMQGVERVLFGLRFLELKGSAPRWRAPRRRRRARAGGLHRPGDRRSADGGAAARGVRGGGAAHRGARAPGRGHARGGPPPGQERLLQGADRGDARRARRQARGEAAELEARVGPLAAHLEERRQGSERLRADVAAAETEARGAEAALQDSAQKQHAAEQAQEQARDAQLTVMSRMAALQNARESITGNAERASADLLKLAAEREELERERARAETSSAVAQERAAGRGGPARGLARRSASRQRRARRTRGRRRSRSSASASARQSEYDSLAGRLSSLEEIVATHAAFDDGTRALLARPEGVDVIAVVADLLESDSAHERAVEAFLGDRLQAVLVPDAAHAVRGVRYLQESGAGRGSFLPLGTAGGRDFTYALRETARHEPRVTALVSDLYRVVRATRGGRARLPARRPRLRDARRRACRRGPAPALPVRHPGRGDGAPPAGRGWPRREGPARAPPRDPRGHGAPPGAGDASWPRCARSRRRRPRARKRRAAEAHALEERIHDAEKDLVAIRHDLAVAEEERSRLERKHGVLEAERRQAEEERGAAAVRLAEIEQSLAAGAIEREAGAAPVVELRGRGRPVPRGERGGAGRATRKRAARWPPCASASPPRRPSASGWSRSAQDLALRIEAARERAREMEERTGRPPGRAGRGGAAARGVRSPSATA